MTRFLRNVVSFNGRGSGVRLAGDTWRRVPRVNLLARRRAAARDLLVAVLAAVLLVELIVVFGFYSGLSSARSRIDEATPRLEQLRGDLKVEDATLAGLYDQVELLQKAGGSAQGALTQLGGARRDWDSSLSALFGAEVPGVLFGTVTTSPSGTIKVVGSAVDEASFGRFQSHLRTLSQLLNIQSFQLGRGRDGLDFTAMVSLK